MAKYIFDEAFVSEKTSLSQMTSTGFSSDSGNTTLNINCGYSIGSRTISKLYIHGDCSFILKDSAGNNILEFKFATTDGTVDNFYYKENEDYCVYTWVGKRYYYESRNIEAQVRVFKNGTFDILQSSTFKNTGATVKITEASKTITYTLQQNISYVFSPSTDNGLDYTCKKGGLVVQGCYVLVDDEGSIKYFNEDLNSYTDTGSNTLTKDVFMEYGYYKVPPTREGLVSSEPLIRIYEEKEDIPSYSLETEYVENRWHKLELKDFYNVSKFGISGIASSFTLDEFSDVRVVINKNNEGWFTFNGTEWEDIDINSSDEITNKGMTMEILNAIPQDKLEGINTFKFALFVKKSDKNSSLKINSVIFNYINPKVEEVKG